VLLALILTGGQLSAISQPAKITDKINRKKYFENLTGVGIYLIKDLESDPHFSNNRRKFCVTIAAAALISGKPDSRPLSLKRTPHAKTVSQNEPFPEMLTC